MAVCNQRRRRCYLQSIEAHTVFGNTRETHRALLDNTVGLRSIPILGGVEGDACPLGLLSDMDPGVTPPRWWDMFRRFIHTIPGGDWGTPRRPVIVTGSNYGIDGLYDFGRTREAAHREWATAHGCVAKLQAEGAWGLDITVISHACVSAQLGFIRGMDWIVDGICDEVLVVSFDFIGPFVTGGFHALKILNAEFPQPFADRPTGSIGLGDGYGYAILGSDPTPFILEGGTTYNELFHFTANNPDGSGFQAVLKPLADHLEGQQVWIKGHGTGTLEAGRLEAETIQAAFPDAPLVSWKGSIGHTLGTCGLVELAITREALLTGSVPGTVGSQGPCFSSQVALEPFDSSGFGGVVLLSNAFGGAHAGLFLRHDH